MGDLPDQCSDQKDLEKQEIKENKGSHSEPEPPGISFDPPVYRQRYSIVFQMVQKYNAKKVGSLLITGIPAIILHKLFILYSAFHRCRHDCASLD